jgi:hypothetical protein
MVDEILDLCGRLALTGDKIKGITIQTMTVEETQRKGELCVVGRLLADRVVGKEVICSTLMRIWKLFYRMIFKDLDANLFLLEFSDEGDKRRVWKGRP